MAAETEAEINMRHLETVAADEPRRRRPRGLDEALFEETVDRLMELRPTLSRAGGCSAPWRPVLGGVDLDRDQLGDLVQAVLSVE